MAFRRAGAADPRKHERPVMPRQSGPKRLRRRPAERSHRFAGLAFLKPQARAARVKLRTLEPYDLTRSTARQRQKAHGLDRLPGFAHSLAPS
jgi:hypothetical protein